MQDSQGQVVLWLAFAVVVIAIQAPYAVVAFIAIRNWLRGGPPAKPLVRREIADLAKEIEERREKLQPHDDQP